MDEKGNRIAWLFERYLKPVHKFRLIERENGSYYVSFRDAVAQRTMFHYFYKRIYYSTSINVWGLRVVQTFVDGSSPLVVFRKENAVDWFGSCLDETTLHLEDMFRSGCWPEKFGKSVME